MNKKIIIGLTGNIATGKTEVRIMLEKLGAYSIDADNLTHRALEKNSPVYQKVINEFGDQILGPKLDIDRKKLGNIVFSNPNNLKKLESILHPIIREATNFLIEKTKKKVIVVEAIKLIESPLKNIVDYIWVTTSSQEKQLKRLSEQRGLSNEKASKIMSMQSSQDEKVRFATSIINNDGSLEDLQRQVEEYWNEVILKNETEDIITGSEDVKGISIVRAKPSDADTIIKFILKVESELEEQTKLDINCLFGDRAYFLLMAEKNIVGVVGWQTENFITKVEEVWLRNDIDCSTGIAEVTKEIERASRQLHAEVILILVNEKMEKQFLVLKEFGFSFQKVELFHTKAWKNAAKDSINTKSEILYKQLMHTKL